MREPPPVHPPCGTPVRWKSVISDDLEPAMILWCDHCDTALSREEIAGDMWAVSLEVEEVADHLRLVKQMRSVN